MQVNDLKSINNDRIKQLEEDAIKGQKDLELKIEIHKKIQELLEKDEAVFFNIQYDEAMKILSYIVPEEDIKETYRSLTSAETFKDLKRRFKI